MARGRSSSRGVPPLALPLLHFLLWAGPVSALRQRSSGAGSGRRPAAASEDVGSDPEEVPQDWRGPDRSEKAEELQNSTFRTRLRRKLDGLASIEDSPQRGAVVHFLFLLRGSFPHADIWKQFFAAAPPGSWAAWAHCSELDSCQRSASLKAFNLTIVPHVHSEWFSDLVTPEVQLLRSAMEPPPEGGAAASPLAGGPPLTRRPAMEKFVIVSDSTLPVKPFSAVFKALTESTESDYCYNTVDQWATATMSGRNYTIPKHWQWVVLNRTDAEQLVRRWRTPPGDGGLFEWNVTLPDGTEVPRAQFPWSPETPDEQIESIALGAMELKTSTPFEEMNLFRNEHRRCRTYLIFIPDIAVMKRAPPVVMTYDSRVNVTIRMTRDRATKVMGPNSRHHPAVFRRIGKQTMATLRDSDYLFARKFEGNVPQDWSRFFGL